MWSGVVIALTYTQSLTLTSEPFKYSVIAQSDGLDKMSSMTAGLGSPFSQPELLDDRDSVGVDKSEGLYLEREY